VALVGSRSKAIRQVMPKSVPAVGSEDEEGKQSHGLEMKG